MDRQQDFVRDTGSDSVAGAGPDGEIDASIEAPAIETPNVIGTDERRMHVRAYNYWVSLLDGRAYPSVEDLELDNASDFGPQSVLLDFTHAGDVPAIAWLGDKLRAECDLTDDVASVSEVPSRSLLSRLTDHHLQIIANRAPIGFEAEFENARGNNTMYRGILLPFSSDNDTIDFIYGVINWKEVASAVDTSAIAQELAANIAPAPVGAPAPQRPVAPAWADGPSGAGRGVPAPLTDYHDDDEDAPEASEGDSLGEWLAVARASADVAQSADTRSRAALYRALSGAYDFALVAEARGEEYAELLGDAKISVQARAPMTPVAKLVFGAGYDKTRLTEFAAALSFAHRRELPAGGMKLFLENFPGGLKAIVAAERRARRPEGAEVKPDATRELARAMPEQAYLTLSGHDEFVVLVARRVDGERVAVIGVVSDDKPLLDRALRDITAAS